MHAFPGHASAIEVLRTLSVEKDLPQLAGRWPREVMLGVEAETPDSTQALRRGKLFAELMPRRAW